MGGPSLKAREFTRYVIVIAGIGEAHLHEREVSERRATTDRARPS
jgi:hypothetical protein